MSILNVNKINPVGGGSTITIAGIASVTSNISVSGSIVAGSTITGEHHGDGSNLTGINVDSTKIETGNTKIETVDTGSDGHIKITTEGSERLRITSAGKVGIGTDNPLRQLQILGDADTCVRLISSAGGVASYQLGDTTDHIKAGITFKSNDNSLRIRGHNNDDRIIINSNGIVTKPNQPSFHATKTNGDAPANSYVVFNNVNHNNGSHYNASDGKFTAPVTGVYYFSVWHYTGSTSAISFRINGTQYGAYSWDGQGGFPSWVCPMTAGQYAQIFTVNPYGFRGTADYHNGFNGFLIG